jgi:hypothetical protein
MTSILEKQKDFVAHQFAALHTEIRETMAHNKKLQHGTFLLLASLIAWLLKGSKSDFLLNLPPYLPKFLTASFIGYWILLAIGTYVMARFYRNSINVATQSCYIRRIERGYRTEKFPAGWETEKKRCRKVVEELPSIKKIKNILLLMVAFFWLPVPLVAIWTLANVMMPDG